MSVVYLGTCGGNTLRELAEQVDAGDVTHGVYLSRLANGDLAYRLIGRDDLTYLIGMMTRAAMHMHCDAAYVIPERET